MPRHGDIPFRINRHAPGTLFDQVVDGVKSAIASGLLPPGEQLPTETQLSRHLDVNRSTISRSYERLRWEGLIEQQRGRGSFVAADAPQRLGVAPRRTLRRVGLAYAAQSRGDIPMVQQFLMFDLIDGLSSVLEPLRVDVCHLPLGNVIDGAPERMADSLRDYDGFIVIANPGLTERFVNVAHEQGLPSVGVGWADWPEHTPSVTYDQSHAVGLAAEHLIRQGYRRIGYVGRDDRYIAPSKLQSFINVLDAHGVALPSKRIHVVPIDTGRAFQTMFERLGRGLECDALFVDTDYKAIETVNALLAHGYRVPEDIAVMGYDDIYELATFHPQLSSIRTPRRQIGVCAADLLVHWLPDAPQPDNIVLQAKLVERGSTPAVVDANAWANTSQANTSQSQ